MIEITNGSIQHAIKQVRENYNQISDAVLDKAISNALNRTAQQSKTAAGREIRKIYNVSASTVNKDMKVRYSQPRTLEARVISSGNPISLHNFGAKQEIFSSISGTEVTRSFGYTSFDRKGNASSRITRKKPRNPKSGVSFEVKKGNPQNLPTAFIQNANGGTTVFARGTYKAAGEGFSFAKERLPIAKMTSSSIPLMFADDEVMNPTVSNALELFSNRIDHEINYALSKIK